MSSRKAKLMKIIHNLNIKTNSKNLLLAHLRFKIRRKKKILVIGGSGYTGRVLINDLINDKFKVTNVDLKIYPGPKNQNLESENRAENI